MKIITLMFLISLTCSCFAQKSTFVRVYDLSGKKINRGHVLSVTDSSLQLKRKPAPINISVRSIGLIKTKHSAGNNVLFGSIVGVTSMVTFAVANNQGYTTGQEVGVGTLVGLPLGAAIGGLTVLLKNSKSYLIEGDATKWKAFQLKMTGNDIK